MNVSLILPIYNVEAEIERCLRSVLEQTYSKIEIILVNDCTPDNSMGIAQALITEYRAEAKIKIVNHSVNQGLSAARNSGIKVATGDYLFFLDSDDSLSHHEAIANLLALTYRGDEEQVIQTQGELFYDVVIGNFQKVTDKGILLETGFQKDLVLCSQMDVYQNYVIGALTVTAWGKLIRRDLIIENQLYFKEGIYHEDELWSFLLYKNARYVRTTAEVIYDYFEREGSISFEIKEKNIRDLNFVIEEIYRNYVQLKDQTEKRLTALKLEKLKRRSLKWMSQFDSAFIIEEVRRLKSINTGKESKNIKLILQNCLFLYPLPFIAWYLQKRWH